MNSLKGFACGVSSFSFRSFATSVARYYLYEGMHVIRADRGSYALRVLETGKWENIEPLAFKIDTNGRLLKDANEADKVFQSLYESMKKTVNNHN